MKSRAHSTKAHVAKRLMLFAVVTWIVTATTLAVSAEELNSKARIQPTGNAASVGARAVSSDPRWALTQQWAQEEKERHMHEVQRKQKEESEKSGREAESQQQSKERPCSFPCIKLP
jgi:hypothetical protein